MPFALINPTNQRTNLWFFFAKNIENWRSWKMSLFLVGHFDFFFQNKKLVFFSNENNLGFHMQWGIIWVEIFMITYTGFQPKTTFMYYFAHNCNPHNFFFHFPEAGFRRNSNHNRSSLQFTKNNNEKISLISIKCLKSGQIKKHLITYNN